MASKKTMNIFFLSTCILMVLLTSNFKAIKGEIQCFSLLGTVLPCKDFMTGNAEKPSGECCGNLQGLDNQAKASVDDRKAICNCFKEAASSFPFDPSKLQLLSQVCQLSQDLPIDPNVDCNRRDN
ncbi:hypothetical protein Leryth_021199 [Lithospermum erythrorhizon]|nr:hypothetical protein Leryth_021199 [Lithospermum erythrorhizon]